VSPRGHGGELDELRPRSPGCGGALEQQIVAKKRAEDEVRTLSDHDPLTGVASPRRFGDRLSVALIHAQRYKQRLAIFQLGLDNFGVIEDKHGRQIADDLLKSVAVALESTLRQTDTIARMERDEFTIPAPRHQARGRHRKWLADKLRLALRSPFGIGGHDLVVTASMGVALFPRTGPTRRACSRARTWP